MVCAMRRVAAWISPGTVTPSADGVTVPGDIHAATRRIAQTMGGQYSSTAQDVARGKPNEIDYLNGYVVRRGHAHGITTPINQTLLTLVKLVEKR